MLCIYTKKLIVSELRQSLKYYKHSRYKHFKNYFVNGAQPNLIFSHFNVNTNLIKEVHTNAALRAPILKDTENVYAYNILQSIPIISPGLLPNTTPKSTPITTLDDFNHLLNQNWRSKSATEIVECFKSVQEFCVNEIIPISDGRFNKLVDGLMDHVQDLTDAELSELLACLVKYPTCESYTSHNFHDVWSALDDVCCWRLPNWSIETRFLFADHWYKLNLGRFSDYMFEFINKLNRHVKHVTKNELVHIFFYLQANKRQIIEFHYHDVFDKYVDDMTLEEIAIVCKAFAKAKLKIKLATTYECMIRKLKHELSTASNFCVTRIVEVRKMCKYTVSLIEKLSAKPEKLTKSQLIHAFFYINICRKRFVDFNYENALEKHIRTLTADEMAIVAMGFFKSQSRLRLKFLLAPMIEQTKSDRRIIHEISLTAIVKVLRYSSHVLLVDQLMDLLDHLVPEIDRLSHVCCIHIALLGTTLQFFHEKSLAKVSQKIINDITDPSLVRIKDMERLLVALTMFDYDPPIVPNVYDTIYEEIHKADRQAEFVRYPRCLPSVLNLLSMRKIYSYNLLDQVLRMDRVRELYGKNPKIMPRDVFALDVCVEIECPDYNGHRLDRAFRKRASKWHVEYTPTWDQFKKITSTDKFVLEVTDVVAKIVRGRDNFRPDHVLPNFVKSDIIICKDEKGNFVQPCGFDNYTLGDVMYAPNTNSNLRWLAVVHVNWNNVIRNTTKPLGSVHMKCRQLRAIGYEPILVIWNEFLPLSESQRIDYVRNKINNS